jgi:AAA15 family ATPase/GTPase
MHIEKLELRNFKAFKQLEITFDEKFNVIVGENNIGKSTIFEAFTLWKFAFDRLIQERDQNKFYKAATNFYLPFTDLSQIRLIDDNDLLHKPSENNASITVTVKDGESSFSLKIRFEKPTVRNSYFRFYNSDNFDEFERFSEHIRLKSCSLKNSIFIYQTRPISTISRSEPFYNNGQIEMKISVGKSHDVLRNKVLKTENSQARILSRFAKLEDRLHRVLGHKYTIRFKNKNRTDDEYIRITAECETHRELEISMMGSGFLQILEIFSTIEYIETHADGICLILIDEPDSHIHSDLQVCLIDELKNHADSQIFIITHNDRLVSKVAEGELFYLNETAKTLGKLSPLLMTDFPSVRSGLASVLSELEVGDHLPIVLTEGKTDKKILDTAWTKLFPGIPMPFRILSSGIQIDEESRSGSADTVRRSLEYLSTFIDRKIIGLFDNDREGNEQFKGLNGKIFEPHIHTIEVRKHLIKEIFGLILPPSPERVGFVTPNSLTQRYFVIEHYFSDAVLQQNNLIGDYILQTSVFEVRDVSKSIFSTNCQHLDSAEFESFRILFAKILNLLA